MKNRLESLNSLTKYQYIGDWLIDKYNDYEMREAILKIASKDLYRLVNREVSVNDIENYLYISLVYIAIEHYDQNFYSYLVDYFPETYGFFSEQLVNNRIRDYIKYVRNITDNKNRIIDQVLKDAFVPRKFLLNFYRFLYDVFKIDYDYYFPQERYDLVIIRETEKEIKLLLEEIVNDNLDEDDGEKEGSKYKNYILTKGTLLALKDENSLQNLLPIIIKMLNLFHSDFWDEAIGMVALNRYLLEGFEEWKKDNKNRFTQEKKSTTTHLREVLKPRVLNFDLGNNAVTIQTRRHIINGAIPGDSIEVQFWNGEKLIKHIDYDNLVLRKTIGGLKIDPMRILITDFLGELKYTVLHNNIEIYSTRSSLYFNYLLFDSQLDVVTSGKHYNDNILIVSLKELQNEQFQHNVIASYHHYRGVVDSYTILNFEGQRIFNTDGFNYKIMSDPSEGVNAFYDSKEVKIYTSLGQLLIEVTNEDLSTLILSINGANYHIDRIGIETEIEATKYFIIDMDFIINKSGIYEIELVNSSRNKDKLMFVYDDKFYTSFDLKNDYSLTHCFKSSLFEEQVLNYSKAELQSNEIEVVKVEKDVKDKILKYELDILIDHYEVNNKKYYFSRYVWTPNLKTNITVYSKDIVGYQIMLNGSTYYTNSLATSTESINIDLQKIELAVSESKDGIAYIIIQRRNAPSIKLLIHKYNIFRTESLTTIPGDESVQIKISYLGMNKMSLKFQNSIDVIETYYLNSDEFIKIDILNDKKYKFEIVEGEGFNPFIKNSIKKIHYEFEYGILSKKELINFDYSLEHAYLDEESKPDYIRAVVMSNLYLDGDGKIRGTLSYHETGSSLLYEFEEINPINIEFIGDVILTATQDQIPIIAHITDCDEDGLMLNKYGSTIDTNMDAKFGPINHFLITIKENKND